MPGRRHSRGFQQIQERPTQLLSAVLHRCTDRSGARRVANRSGNVHESSGAKAFVLDCIAAVRAIGHCSIHIKARMDSAFFSDEILTALEQDHVRYTISVPFARLLSLKDIIERRIDWQPIDPLRDAFRTSWQPKSCGENRSRRFLFVRQFNARTATRQPAVFTTPNEHRYGLSHASTPSGESNYSEPVV